MCKAVSNTACNNTAFTGETLAGMSEMHPTMARLYRAVDLLHDVRGQSALAREMNTSPQRIKNWESRGISQTGANEAQAQLGINATWLLTGDGSMAVETSDPSTSSQFVRMDPETMVEAIRLVRERYLVRDVELTIAHLERDGTILASAYEFQARRKEEGQPPGNVVDFSKYLQGARGAGELEEDGGRHRAVNRG